MNRVAITGSGTINSLGHSAKETFTNMAKGSCGIGPLFFRDVDRLDIKIGGQGCSISQASASMMTEIIKGKSVTEAEEIIHAFKEMMDIYESELSGEQAERSTSDIDLGDLEALQGVVKYPVRIKCATLAWNTLTQSIDEIQCPD